MFFAQTFYSKHEKKRNNLHKDYVINPAEIKAGTLLLLTALQYPIYDSK